MGERDRITWSHVVHQLTEVLDYLLYDVPLGHVTLDVLPDDPLIVRQALRNCRPRADAVAILQDRALVIEIKPVCSPQAIGQALVYADLARTTDLSDLPIIPMVACLRVPDYVIPTLQRLHVGLITPDNIVYPADLHVD